MSRIVLTAASHIGCVRSNNEDMVLAFDKMVRSDAYQTEFTTENNAHFVIALADGMGGHRAGEVASELVLSNLKYYVGDLPRGMAPGEVHEAMMEWLHSANNIVNSRGNGNPELRDMGTTLVGVLYYERHVYWMNCGDSRLYRFRDGHLEQLTTDHSLNNMTGEKKHSNVITNCIGAGIKHLFLDMMDFTKDFLPGDTYLLCSDGLNDMVPDKTIEELLAQGADANQLCQKAVEYGGFDNVSAIVFHVNP